ncbi:MAG: PRC-barrel domain-containing protein [Planctomycetota bacterium]
MNTRISRIPARISTLMLAAGLAVPAAGQYGEGHTRDRDDRQQRQADRQPDRQQMNRSTSKTDQTDDRKRLSPSEMKFVQFEELEGAAVVNANHTEIGTLDDLLIDRGSGEISDVVILFDDFLGLGGERVAVPFESLRFDRDDGEVGLDVTPEQLEDREQIKPERWERLESDGSDDQWFRLSERDEGNKHADPYAYAGGESPKTNSVTGTIEDVVRFDTVDDVEFVSVNVRPEGRDSELTRVVLGPSWFVMSKDNAPMQGDRISVEAFELSDDTLKRMVATTATIDGKKMKLRDGNAKATWSTGDRKAISAPRLMLMSNLIGTDISARDREAGEISCAFIEVKSGKVTLLGVDPNENFLGINDEEIIVPISSVSIGVDTVRADASPNELKRARELPDDPQQLASRSMLNKVYGPFGTEPAVLRQRPQRNWDGTMHLIIFTDEPGQSGRSNEPRSRDRSGDRNRGG